MEKVIRVLVANRPPAYASSYSQHRGSTRHRNCWRSWRRVGDLREHKENPARFRGHPRSTTLAQGQHFAMSCCANTRRSSYRSRPGEELRRYYWASLNIHSNDIEASEEGILNTMRSRMVANGAI